MDLPGPTSNEAINMLLVQVGLPQASKIVAARVKAEYHSIYIVTIPSDSNSLPQMDLVLRVSGHHLPRIKTNNEVGIMSWISKNTTIPIPKLFAHDNSIDNPIAHEYTLLSRSEGETLSDIYTTLNEAEISDIIDQIIDILGQLHDHEWDAIGGLILNGHGEIELGPIVDETFWQSSDLELWPDSETVTSLNIAGPYQNYVDYVTAQVCQNIRLILVHDKLAFMRSDIPRLEAFLAALPQHAAQLNSTKLRLAHKDLHWANLLYDKKSSRISAVLDWEFSGVVQFQQWDPRRAFLWTGQKGEEGIREKSQLQDLFAERCKNKGMVLLDDAAYTSRMQEAMQSVVDFLRAIVEVTPRDQRSDLVQSWMATLRENLAHFGV